MASLGGRGGTYLDLVAVTSSDVGDGPAGLLANGLTLGAKEREKGGEGR